MAAFRASLALVAGVLLSACANLTAEAPLFSVADQAGPPPLAEGVWIALGEDCPERNLTRSGRFPKECAPLEIDRTADGAWRVRARADLAAGLTREERQSAEADAERIMRLVIAPAVERQIADAYAPLYVAESAPQTAEEHVSYLLIVPEGELPARSAMVLGGIDCATALRDGPIEGVAERYTERVDAQGNTSRELSGCVASSKAAVREAARRAAIENLATLHDARYAYVGRR